MANASASASAAPSWTCDSDDWSGLTSRQFGFCFWLISDTSPLRWPQVLIPRCETLFAITPYVAEFFSTVTALIFIVLGLMNMLSSGHSDEVVDLAASVFVINGVSAAMSHGTQWRFWGQMDAITINVMALFFLYAVMQASRARHRPARAARSFFYSGRQSR